MDTKPIKPLKNHRYINESEAAELLSSRIGEVVTVTDMAGYALNGVVPAYMRYRPANKTGYPEDYFELIRTSELREINIIDLRIVPDSEMNMHILPFPLPSDGTVTDSRGTCWRVFAGRSDGRLEPVREEHFVRIYAPREVNRAAKTINDQSDTSWPPVRHSCGETWEIDRDAYRDGETVSFLSPFEMGTDNAEFEKRSALLAIAGMCELLTSEGRAKYTQGDISLAIRKRHPNWRGVGASSLNHLFAEANALGSELDKPIDEA